MAYTRDWATEVIGTPLGSRDSDEIDDSIREFKVDLDERFADIVKDPAADPWEAKPLASQIRYPWSLGYAVSVSGTLGVGSQVNPVGASAAAVVYVPVIVPVGMRLVDVKFRLNVASGAAANGTVTKTDVTGAISFVGAPAVAVGAGWIDVSIGAVSELCAAGSSFLATVTLNNSGGTASFMDMEVTLEGE